MDRYTHATPGGNWLGYVNNNQKPDEFPLNFDWNKLPQTEPQPQPQPQPQPHLMQQSICLRAFCLWRSTCQPGWLYRLHWRASNWPRTGSFYKQINRAEVGGCCLRTAWPPPLPFCAAPSALCIYDIFNIEFNLCTLHSSFIHALRLGHTLHSAIQNGLGQQQQQRNLYKYSNYQEIKCFFFFGKNYW